MTSQGEQSITQGTLFELPAKQKYRTIYGFYARDLWLGLVKNKKNPGEEVILFKFLLGHCKGENLVSWLPVVIRGKAAENFLDLIAEGLSEKDMLSLRGAYQQRPRNGSRQFWAFEIEKVERDEKEAAKL